MLGSCKWLGKCWSWRRRTELDYRHSKFTKPKGQRCHVCEILIKKPVRIQKKCRPVENFNPVDTAGARGRYWGLPTIPGPRTVKKWFCPLSRSPVVPTHVWRVTIICHCAQRIRCEEFNFLPHQLIENFFSWNYFYCNTVFKVLSPQADWLTAFEFWIRHCVIVQKSGVGCCQYSSDQLKFTFSHFFRMPGSVWFIRFDTQMITMPPFENILYCWSFKW